MVTFDKPLYNNPDVIEYKILNIEPELKQEHEEEFLEWLDFIRFNKDNWFPHRTESTFGCQPFDIDNTYYTVEYEWKFVGKAKDFYKKDQSK